MTLWRDRGRGGHCKAYVRAFQLGFDDLERRLPYRRKDQDKRQELQNRAHVQVFVEEHAPAPCGGRRHDHGQREGAQLRRAPHREQGRGSSNSNGE